MNQPQNDDKNLWVSWDEYHRLVERLALKVYESNWKFDKILCLARGGLRVGDQLARIYDVPLAILATSSYREAEGPFAVTSTSRSTSPSRAASWKAACCWSTIWSIRA